jgi:hypothetical protein
MGTGVVEGGDPVIAEGLKSGMNLDESKGEEERKKKKSKKAEPAMGW